MFAHPSEYTFCHWQDFGMNDGHDPNYNALAAKCRAKVNDHDVYYFHLQPKGGWHSHYCQSSMGSVPIVVNRRRIEVSWFDFVVISAGFKWMLKIINGIKWHKNGSSKMRLVKFCELPFPLEQSYRRCSYVARGIIALQLLIFREGAVPMDLIRSRLPPWERVLTFISMWDFEFHGVIKTLLNSDSVYYHRVWEKIANVSEYKIPNWIESRRH
jgi:hypothetical protein